MLYYLSIFSTTDAFRKTIAAFGGLDIMVNNAGVFNDRFWEFEVDVNLVICFVVHNVVFDFYK